jgi:trimeric autotransporter adhesin
LETIMDQHMLALRLGFAIILAPALCYTQQYTITTAAGGANPYYLAGTGDGGPATLAGLGDPSYDVAVDGMGNLYMIAGSLIRAVTPAGTISTVAGGGQGMGDYVPATQAALASTAIAVSSTGTLYIADTAFGTSRVRTVTGAGTIVTVAGGAPCCVLGDGGPALAAYIGVPLGLAVDHSGNIYIAQSDNSGNYRIRKISNGTIATVAGGGANTGDGGLAISASLARPTGVAVDMNGNLYIAESGANRIRKVSNGTITTVAAIDSPWHVTVDSNGNLYVTQPNDATAQSISASGTVIVIAGDGTHGYSGDGGPSRGAEMDRPSGIALGSNGPIYISDATTGIARVRQLTATPRTVCDVNQYGSTTVADVQATLNAALGAIAPLPAYDLNQDGVVNVVDVQLVTNSALGLGCGAS